jgi:glutathione S-transferase
MYTLFWEKGSGSIAVQAQLEEAGIPYRKSYVDMEAGEHRQESYLGENPTGLVPALKLPDGRTIGESAAIVLHLGEQGGEQQLVPATGDAERPVFMYWLMFLATSGYTTFGRFAHPERYTVDPDALSAVSAAAANDIDAFFDVLDVAIAGDPWFLESGFGALDIYTAMLAGWHPQRNALFDRNPKVAALCRAVENRPAYRKVISEHA